MVLTRWIKGVGLLKLRHMGNPQMHQITRFFPDLIGISKCFCSFKTIFARLIESSGVREQQVFFQQN